MKYLKLFNESNYNHQLKLQSNRKDILSHDGWTDVHPTTNDNFESELIYNIKGDIYIDVLKLKSSKNMIFYLRKGTSRHYISDYNVNHSELFSQYSSVYMNMSDYDRMMNICRYLLPFFEKEPTDDFIEDIKECFVEIGDELGEPTSSWGYYNGEDDDSFFPAFSFSDQLCLLLNYEYNHRIDFKSIKKEFNDCLPRLQMFNIHRSNVEIIEHDDIWKSVIKIKIRL